MNIVTISSSKGISNSINIPVSTTIGQLKSKLYPYVHEYKNPHIRFTFNNGTELSPIVFTANNYDNVNFQQYSLVLPGSQIYISETKETKTKATKIPIYILLDDGQKFLYSSTDKTKTLKYFTNHHINVTGFITIEGMFTELYWIEEPPDYNNPEHMKAIIDEIDEAHFIFIEGILDWSD